MKSENDVPQERVHGSILLIMYINLLFNLPIPAEVRFADDSHIFQEQKQTLINSFPGVIKIFNSKQLIINLEKSYLCQSISVPFTSYDNNLQDCSVIDVVMKNVVTQIESPNSLLLSTAI